MAHQPRDDAVDIVWSEQADTTNAEVRIDPANLEEVEHAAAGQAALPGNVSGGLQFNGSLGRTS